MAAFSPAARTADGPMSTPRRSCPRSSGTPRILIFMLPPYGVARPKEGTAFKVRHTTSYIIHPTPTPDAEARAASRFCSIGGLLWIFDGVLLTNRQLVS